MRIGREFGLGDTKNWGEDPDGKYLLIGCPDEAHPTDPYSVTLYNTFYSDDLEGPLVANQVVSVSAEEEDEFPAVYPIDFYDE